MPRHKIDTDQTDDTEGQGVQIKIVENGEPEAADTEGQGIKAGRAPAVDATEADDTEGNKKNFR